MALPAICYALLMNVILLTYRFYQKITEINMAKKEGIRKLFDNIAPDYDKLNHILSLNIDKGWRKKAVREIADTDKPVKVLDVACELLTLRL